MVGLILCTPGLTHNGILSKSRRLEGINEDSPSVARESRETFVQSRRLLNGPLQLQVMRYASQKKDSRSEMVESIWSLSKSFTNFCARIMYLELMTMAYAREN